MSDARTLGVLQLIVALTFGGWATKSLRFDNGFVDFVKAAYDNPEAYVPGSKYRWQKTFIGNAAIDRFLATFNGLAYHAFGGGEPSYSLQTIHSHGQLVAGTILMLVECYRVGNSWRLISFATLWLLLAQNVGAMVVIPLWCLAHLLTSPTLAPAAPSNIRRTSLLVHPAELVAIPCSVFFGVGLSLAMIYYLPWMPASPQWRGAQFWAAARQVGPLLTAVAHILVSVVGQFGSSTFDSPTQRNRAVARSLRNVYAVAKYLAIVTHAGVLGLTLATQFNPGAFSGRWADVYSPASVWRPVRFWRGVAPAEDFTGGGFQYAQWDEIITASALFVWAFALNREGVARAGEGPGYVAALLKGLAMAVVGGPVAGAIALVQERDEVWLEQDIETEAKKSQ